MSNRGKILVVDDHVDLAENIADILAGAGYDTVVADSAERALARLEEEGIDALITDFKLPGRNGAELITELRRRGSDIPAVVMSAYTDEGTIESAQVAGAFDVLPKPVDIARLMALVSALGRNEALVLIVDDNRPLAENLAEVLRGRGYDAVISTSAAEALAHTARAQAAIIDYRLPDRTGVHVAERLASRDPRIKILFVSAYLDELRARLGGTLADSLSLEKPVDVSRLLSWVAEAVQNAKTDRSHR